MAVAGRGEIRPGRLSTGALIGAVSTRSHSARATTPYAWCPGASGAGVRLVYGGQQFLGQARFFEIGNTADLECLDTDGRIRGPRHENDRWRVLRSFDRPSQFESRNAFTEIDVDQHTNGIARLSRRPVLLRRRKLLRVVLPRGEQPRNRATGGDVIVNDGDNGKVTGHEWETPARGAHG